MWILAFIIDIILGYLIIGEPLWRFTTSPFFLTLYLTFCLIFWTASRLFKSEKSLIRKTGVALIIMLIISTLLFLISSWFRNVIISFTGIEPPEVSFKGISTLQWIIWGIVGFIINSLLLPKADLTPEKDNSDMESQKQEGINDEKENI